MPLLRGVGIVLHPVYSHVKKGPLAPLMLTGNWDATDPDTSQDQALLDLRSAWTQEDASASLYDQVLLELRRCSAFMQHFIDGSPSEEYGYNGPWSGPFIWLHCASQEYVTKLHQRQPIALLIFAHFGALLQRLDHIWVTAGWGSRIVSVVDEILGSYWDRWMQWPREVVGIVQQ